MRLFRYNDEFVHATEILMRREMLKSVIYEVDWFEFTAFLSEFTPSYMTLTTV